MTGQQYFINRFLGDLYCNNNLDSWICKPLPGWVGTSVLVIGLGSGFYFYYKDSGKSFPKFLLSEVKRISTIIKKVFTDPI